MAAEIDVIAYLERKGYRGKKGSGPEFAFPCFFPPGTQHAHKLTAGCDEPPGSRKRKLYVNSEEGFYNCKVCGANGGSTLLLRYFGEEDKVTPIPGADLAARRAILEQAAAAGMEMLSNSDKVMLYLLNERGLSPETIIERQLGYVTKPWSLTGSIKAHEADLLNSGLAFRDGPRKGHDFFYDHILIPYQSRGTVVQVRGKVLGGKYFTGPGESVRLFNTDSLAEADEVILTEGEFDCMALVQHLSTSPEDRIRKIAVVGLAGTGALPQAFESYFSEARRVFIALDPDDPGKRAAVSIKEKLGTKARIVQLPDFGPKCDWTEFLLPVPPDADTTWHREHPHAGHGWRDVIELLGEASGKRLFTVSEAAEKWRSRTNAGTGIKFGFSTLDANILPGLLPGQLAVVLAKTGVGKTVWLCNVAYNTRSVPTLFISLEMTAEEVYERLRRIYLFHDPRAIDAEIDMAYGDLMICDENRLNERDFQTLVDEYEIERGVRPEMVMVDYLGYYARGMRGGSPYEKTSEAVMQLKAAAKANRVGVIAPHQVNRVAKEGKPIDMDDARDSGVVEETADFLFSLWRPDDALREENAQPTGKVKLTNLKSRHGGKGLVITMQMDLLTLAIVDEHTAEAREAAQHNYMLWRGQTYEDLRRAQTAPVQIAMKGA